MWLWDNTTIWLQITLSTLLLPNLTSVVSGTIKLTCTYTVNWLCVMGVTTMFPVHTDNILASVRMSLSSHNFVFFQFESNIRGRITVFVV